jgi:3-keto-disaccharide hydrolase
VRIPDKLVLIMRKVILLSLAAAAIAAIAPAQTGNPFLGRWDITVTTGRDTYPDWMEIMQTDCCLAAIIQPRAGGRIGNAELKREGSHLTVKFRGNTVWELTSASGQLNGVIKQNDKETGKLVAVPAPALYRPMPKAWTDPEPIFNGKDLTGWEPMNPPNNHWAAQNGELVNEAKGSNLKTTRKFNDFKLHIEYNCPADGNSGIYLRGRYEVQVEYEAVDANDRLHSIGSIYSSLAPAVDLPRTPGKWETFDITLVGRTVTIVRNGVKTIDQKQIPGITGGALDSNEGEPGPMYLQGDHTGGMKYRNITISVPK